MCKEKRTEENSSQKKSGAEEKECKNEEGTRRGLAGILVYASSRSKCLGSVAGSRLAPEGELIDHSHGLEFFYGKFLQFSLPLSWVIYPSRLVLVVV